MSVSPQTVSAPAVLPPSGVRRMLAGGPDPAQHLAAFGPLPPVGPAVLDELARAGIDGRGGAGFPFARKLDAVRRAADDARGRRAGAVHRPAVVVANAAEGEPASRKDAVLLREAPHLVLDGLVVAALAVGASEAVLATTADRAPDVRRALGARRDPVRITVRDLPHASFVGGEASAVASAVSGGSGLPVDRVVRLAERGPSGRRTLVANVETLAAAALVARFGATWHRSVGTPSAPGTRLVTVSDVREPATAETFEVAGGTRVGDVIRASRQDPSRARAVLVGGWGGTWVPPEALGASFDADGLAPFGAAPGAGVLAVLHHGTCPVDVTARIATALAGASAGRCGPCVNGLPRVADVIVALAARRGPLPGLVDEVARVTALVDGRGACHHPDGVARMVRSAMAVFRDDVDAHLAGYCVAAGVTGRHDGRSGR